MRDKLANLFWSITNVALSVFVVASIIWMGFILWPGQHGVSEWLRDIVWWSLGTFWLSYILECIFLGKFPAGRSFNE